VTATGSDSAGSFAIPVGKIKLRGGHYWVSVQANMDFGTGGEWGWDGRAKKTKSPAVWMNPGDGFATRCTTFANMATCVPSGEGPDLVFQLGGTAS
jgi:hypothetical protein